MRDSKENNIHGLCGGIGIDQDKLHDVVNHLSIHSLNTTCSKAFHLGLPACDEPQDGKCSNDTSCFVILFKNYGHYGGCMCQLSPNDETKLRCNELDSPTTPATPATPATLASTSPASSTMKITSRTIYLSFSDTFETPTFVALPTNFPSKISAVMTSSPTAIITTGTSQTESHIGAIIGGTIGGLLTIALCLALAFFYRRYKDKSPPPIELIENPGSNTPRPVILEPMRPFHDRSKLEAVQRSEMAAPPPAFNPYAYPPDKASVYDEKSSRYGYGVNDGL